MVAEERQKWHFGPRRGTTIGFRNGIKSDFKENLPLRFVNTAARRIVWYANNMVMVEEFQVLKYDKLEEFESYI